MLTPRTSSVLEASETKGVLSLRNYSRVSVPGILISELLLQKYPVLQLAPDTFILILQLHNFVNFLCDADPTHMRAKQLIMLNITPV